MAMDLPCNEFMNHPLKIVDYWIFNSYIKNTYKLIYWHNPIQASKPQSLPVIHKYGRFYGCHEDGRTLYSK